MTLRNRLYYRLKPLLPPRLRLALRRRHARALRRQHSHLWPILPGSERPPHQWPGWPGGRKFAFVLTHDVEGPRGADNIRRLAELDHAHGLRASFGLVPEGTYPVDAELRARLRRQDHDVCVHDLHHDGRLFESEVAFRDSAPRINHHLRAWGSRTFRSAFMLHHLPWLHQLEIDCDMSTFDHDPFEPQPDGQDTIFPFWVPAPSSTGNGYAELPYTLPQDSTLFLCLEETGPELWIRKLDWIAAHGGMALVNVHPDYLQFEDQPASPRTYPVSHYLTLLRHLSARHGGHCWQALPSEVAAWVRQPARRPAACGHDS